MLKHFRHPPENNLHFEPHSPTPDLLVEALTEFHRAHRACSLEELAKVASSYLPDGPEAAKYLAGSCAGLPVKLAISKLAQHRCENAYHRTMQLWESVRESRIALITPLPPHLLDTFAHLQGTSIICLDGHLPPPHLHKRMEQKVVMDAFDARETVRQAEVILFDAFLQAAQLLVRKRVIDLLTPLPKDAKLHVHFRPHRHMEDASAPSEMQPHVIQL